MKSPRALAMEVLLAREKSHAPLDRVLEEACCASQLADPRDRQLAMALAYGVMRWQGWLDQVLGELASHPLAKMKPLTRAALRVGLFQLFCLERVPPAAAINETVQALRQAGQPKWLVGFVNGVLRAAARASSRFAPPDAAAALASHPAWLVARWHELFGPARTNAICWANNQEPPLVVRIEPDKSPVAAFISQLTEAGLATAEPGRYAPAAVRIEGWRGPVASLPGYHEGLFQVQDEAAQLVVPLLGALPEEGRGLDACAGLGGKTVQWAALLAPSARLTAVEPNLRRLGLLAENLHRAGLPPMETFQGELAAFVQTNPPLYDAVLVDAPCSGLGVIRRQPDIRWERSLDELGRYQARQRELIAAAAGLVRPGGVLVYATCSIDPLENDAVIEAFLADHQNFLLSPAQEHLPASARSLVDPKGFLRTSPEQGLDGFFAARLEKTK
ncbi:MAG: 16S rRNA (cytosine(967)-C(5))-methyltransferase RsmB [Thermodesulfobacteriota bacterium]